MFVYRGAGCKPASPGNGPNSLARRRAPSYALAGQRMESGTTDRERLPQLDGGLFLTDGGIETVLIFHEGVDLPAVRLVRPAQGRRRHARPFAATTSRTSRSPRRAAPASSSRAPTWRASPDWAAELGHSDEDLAGFNRKAIELMREIRDEQRVGDRPDRGQRLRRAARRRLPARRADERGRGRPVPLGPDRRLRRGGRRHGHRDHDDLPGGGDRDRPRRGRRRPTGGDLVHGRDRRPPADRSGPRGGDRAGRRGDRRSAPPIS